MNLQDVRKLLQIIRARWLTVFVTALVIFFATAATTILTTPLYEASTRLFVSTSAGASVSDLYQGNRLSLDRVSSYTELLKGEALAQRTVDKLDLSETAADLRGKVRASAKRDTVLIDLSVRDKSPVRARDIANAMSDEFAAMVRELETPRPGAEPDARVIVQQRATVPTKPVVPKKARNIVGGLAIGLLLGVALAIVRDLLDNTIKDRETLEQVTGVGLVGSIPADKELVAQSALNFDRDNSPVAEAFRKLRTNLQFLHVDNPPRVIVVTSSGPSEGKSTTSINIALALAEADHNVVLVDGDMRRPKLSDYIGGLVGSVGFSTVLGGAASLDEAIQLTNFPRLSVLTSGTIPPNPSELLGSQTAKRVLAELSEKFDYVIVDSAPLLAVTDGAVLAANADGALLMTRFGRTKREQLAHAVRSLEDVGATLLGAVLTVVPERHSKYYGYSYNYYSDARNDDGSGNMESR